MPLWVVVPLGMILLTLIGGASIVGSFSGTARLNRFSGLAVCFVIAVLAACWLVFLPR